MQEKIGTDLAIADVVEAVFLNAFEGYDRRPPGVRFGQWLETSPESGAVRPEDTEKLLAVAPKYGIEIKLPPS